MGSGSWAQLLCIHSCKLQECQLTILLIALGLVNVWALLKDHGDMSEMSSTNHFTKSFLKLLLNLSDFPFLKLFVYKLHGLVCRVQKKTLDCSQLVFDDMID